MTLIAEKFFFYTNRWKQNYWYKIKTNIYFWNTGFYSFSFMKICWCINRRIFMKLYINMWSKKFFWMKWTVCFEFRKDYIIIMWLLITINYIQKEKQTSYLVLLITMNCDILLLSQTNIRKKDVLLIHYVHKYDFKYSSCKFSNKTII